MADIMNMGSSSVLQTHFHLKSNTEDGEEDAQTFRFIAPLAVM